MVEPQIVVLVVAGSSPVGHPRFCSLTRETGYGHVRKKDVFSPIFPVF